MSNNTNSQILENIAEEVDAMSTSNILRELVGGMKPGISESWDQRVALADRDIVMDKLIEKRFEEICR
tara:strand:- start:1665 stop:1868 length:204 start_codon:yes stop_codon:yes gene_type:complete